VNPLIATLIPKLASDHDGEVVATVRAIGRLLKSDGLDWHDLAKSLNPRPNLRVAQPTAPPPASRQTTSMAGKVNHLYFKSKLDPQDMIIVSGIKSSLDKGRRLLDKEVKYIEIMYNAHILSEMIDANKKKP
jgi:hypothetical protein